MYELGVEKNEGYSLFPFQIFFLKNLGLSLLIVS